MNKSHEDELAEEKRTIELISKHFDPYLGEGPNGQYFCEEYAVMRLLVDDVMFVNSRKYLDLDGKTPRDETLLLFLSCNDVFYWACGDAEPVSYKELRGLYEMHVADPSWGTTKWVCLKRKMAPQKPVERDMRAAGAWTEELDKLQKPSPS